MFRLFNHYIPRPIILLATIELLVLFFAVHFAVHVRFAGEVMASTHLNNIPLEQKALVFAVLMLLMLMSMGLYQRHLRNGFRDVFMRVLVAFILGVVLMATVYYFFPYIYLGRGALALSFLFGLLLVLVIRGLFHMLTFNSLLARRVMAVGTGRTATALEHLRRRADWQGVHFLGFLHIKGDRDEVDPNRIIRSDASLENVCKEFGVDELVVALDDDRKNFPAEDIIACKLHGVQISELSTFFEQRTGKILLEAWSPSRIIFLDGFDNNLWRSTGKRLFDVVLSAMGLILGLPLLMLLWLLVRISGNWRDPSIYKQIRVGQHDKPFTLYKFRSMVVDAERNGAQWASKNDPRVTPLGSFMRGTRLDELPQLWNVLKGDMSFVGPRPERPEFVQQLVKKIPYYAMRHRVKPGITGWAQVNYPYGDSEIDTREKLQYDLYYIKNYSLIFDLSILINTAQVVLWRKGAR